MSTSRLLSKLIIRALLASIWVLRRIDGKLLGSSALRSASEFRADPYPSWARIRHRGPVLRSLANRGWLVIGYREAQQVLRSPDFSNDLRQGRFISRLLRASTGGEPVPFLDNPPLLNQDPPAHTRLRRLVSSGFTKSYIDSLAPFIEQTVERLLGEVDKEHCDVISALAEPLPAIVIARMMGLPEAELPTLLDWSHKLTGATLIGSPGRVAAASRAEREMREYVSTLIDERTAQPRDDFISQLVSAQQADDQLSRKEIIATCILLLAAGHETTTRLIGNGLYLLLTHPEALSQLRQTPALLSQAIEEMLRFEPPVQMTIRFARHATRIGTQSIRAGQMIVVSLGAANRDPEIFENPDDFDIRRTSTHLSFGYGIHLCLGLMLARLEARIVFRHLLAFERIALLDPLPAWQGNPFFRGLEHLPVALIDTN